MPTKIILVTALLCEARPLIDRFQLKKAQEVHAFTFYQNSALALSLIISGVGTINVAAATAFAASHYPNETLAFVNLGIAGAFDVSIGDLRLIHKVSNDQGHSFYPMALSYFQLETEALVTLDQPALAQAGSLLDMEGFGFYQTAARFTSLELVHSLKIISDNQYQDFTQLNQVQVKSWISQHLDTVDFFLKRIKCLASQVSEITEEEANWIKKLCDHFHVSQYHQHQMRGVIKKMLAFDLVHDGMLSLEKSQSIKHWLENMENQIHHYSLRVL